MCCRAGTGAGSQVGPEDGRPLPPTHRAAVYGIRDTGYGLRPTAYGFRVALIRRSDISLRHPETTG